MRIEQLENQQFVKTLSAMEQQIIQRLYQEILERREGDSGFQDQMDAAINRVRLLEETTSAIENKIKTLLLVDFRDFVLEEEHVGLGGTVHPPATELQAGFLSAEDKKFINTIRNTGANHIHENLVLLNRITQSGTETVFDLSKLSLAHKHQNADILAKVTESYVNDVYDLANLHKHTNFEILNKIVATNNKDKYDLANLGSTHDHSNLNVLAKIYQSGNETEFDLSRISSMHEHKNKTTLDRVIQTGAETQFDLSKMSDIHKHSNMEILSKVVASVSSTSYDLSSLHSHANYEALSRFGISASGSLTIDDVEQTMHNHKNMTLLNNVTSNDATKTYNLSNIHVHANYNALERLGVSPHGILTIDGIEINDGHEHDNLDVLSLITATVGRLSFDLSELHKHSNKDTLDKIMQSGTQTSFDLSDLSKAHTHSNRNLLEMIMRSGTQTSFDLSKIYDNDVRIGLIEDEFDPLITGATIPDHEKRITDLEGTVSGDGSGGGSLQSTVNDHEKRLDTIETGKGNANGYASLDGAGTVPLSQLPADAKREIKVVGNILERDLLPTYEGLRVHVIDASLDTTVDSGWAEYIYTGTAYKKTAEKESIDIVLEWKNIVNKELASSTVNGLMSSADFSKLQGIEDGANKYVHPTSHEATMITIADSKNNYTSGNVEGALDEVAQGIKSVATPTGMIMMWRNPTTTPSGWYVCDGTNGTPDMRDHFIYLAATPTNDDIIAYIMKG